MEQGIEVVAANGMVWITIDGMRIGLEPIQAVNLSAAIDEAVGAIVMPTTTEAA